MAYRDEKTLSFELPSYEAPKRRQQGGRRGLVVLSLIALTTLALWNWRASDFSTINVEVPQQHSSHKKPSEANTCLTPACIHASSEILYNLSPQYKELDPCTDFEELVCGGWRERHDLRPDQGDAFTGTSMAENSQQLLRHILEADYPEKSMHSYFSPARLGASSKSADEQNFQKMRDAYDACLDEPTIKNLGVEPLLKVVNTIKEKFPAKSPESKMSQDEKTSAIKDTLVYLSSIGVSALVSPGTGPDDTDVDVVVISVSPPWRIGLPAKERYEDEKLVKKYQDMIISVLSVLMPSGEKDSFADVVEFEKKLAEAAPTQQEREDVTYYYNPMSLESASNLIPQIDLASILKSLAPTDYDIKRIIVASPPYLKKLSDILSDTSDATIQSYFIWKAVQALASYVDAPAVTPYKRFSNELQGKDPDSTPERWRTCVNHVDGGLGWILSRFFIEKAFSAKAKEFGDTIVSDIKDQFVEVLKKTPWMDDKVIDLAIRKVHNIVQKIGYPTESPDVMNPGDLKDYYKEVSVSSSTFLDNALSISKFEEARSWNSLSKPVDRAEWGMSAPTVNAYYNPPGNEIVFPAGIMQFPVFDVNVPPFVSYGAFGAVAGHELSHAFDSTGRHYDQNGNYTDWWTKKTVEEFQKRAQCFVDQYGNYSIDGPDDKPLHVNGRLTLGENIADAGGLSASFAAWQMRRKENSNDNLPGLEHFSQDQLFFVSYANWWCGTSRKETAINRIYTDPHAPKWARILGTMANSKDFRSSFNCPSKKPTCELW
ncbi:endothelin-converting enzyme [Microthyrium microscopicum]|uniref:Endothelin-converting enzyme n=1 Tax=Microthyrium microscopicum TaxID=703497 RepID=A0A6A6UJ68_9PEZI|nr:endothelin-converting enzyme [Microthyrium microscopicum]